MIDLENMSEAEIEAYVREMATRMLSAALNVPNALFILSAVEASTRVLIAAHLEEANEHLTSVEALDKLIAIVQEVQACEKQTETGKLTH